MALISLALLGAVALIVITLVIRLEAFKRVDTRLLDWIQSVLPESTGKARKKSDTMMRDVTALGGDTATVIVALSGSATLFAQGNSLLLPPFLLTLATGRVVGLLLKKWIQRPRPKQAGHALDIFTSSFPSVHTAMGFVSSFAIVFFLLSAASAPWIALSIASIVSALIGTTRLYFAVHWPFDVLAGWFAGLTMAATSALLLTG